MRHTGGGCLACIVVALMCLVSHVGAAELVLSIEAPDSLASVAERIRSYDSSDLLDASWLTDLREPLPVIRVILEPEGSRLAESAPRWIAGFAVSDQDTIVLFPARSPSYPDDSLEAVFRHELAHVLIAHAAGGHRLPRWFNEGLATTVERPWDLEDRSRVVWASLVDARISLVELDERFQQGRSAAARAYALSGALVRNVIQTFGPAAPGHILSAVANGLPFDVAFRVATGRPLAVAQADFWRRQTVWEQWLAFLTSPRTMWSVMTLLALAAIWRRRQKRRAQRKRWDEEEAGLWGGADHER